MKESKLYCCFSVPLMKYFTENNVKYELVALSPNSKRTMWIYIKDDKLRKLLKDWSEKNNLK